MAASSAKSYYQKVQEKILEIHLRIGHFAEMDKKEFNRHIQIRLDVIAERFGEDETIQNAIARIRDYFWEELKEKTIFYIIIWKELLKTELLSKFQFL